MKMPPKPAIWKPPDPSFVKTNFDGAVFEDLDAAGIGIVVRNLDGEVMATLSEIIPKPASVAVLETLAARRAVQFVQELDMKDSIFEGDSEVSISTIKSRSFQHPSCAHLIQDIMALAQSLQNYSFSHVHRQGNALAHAQARRARFSFPVLVWMESVPPDIYKFYVSDLLAIK